MYYPSLKEARELAASGGCRYVPVSRELFSDFITPIQALRILRAKSGHCFLLESAADSAGWGNSNFSSNLCENLSPCCVTFSLSGLNIVPL